MFHSILFNYKPLPVRVAAFILDIGTEKSPITLGYSVLSTYICSVKNLQI